MLSVTKLKNTKENFIYTEFALKPSIDMVISVVKSQYTDKTFEILISNNLPPLLADKDKFQQIMTNLIENAAKYGKENSKITIQASYINDKISIKVINEGIEIQEKDYDKIFTKFSRIDNPLTRKIQGSGLGLYITKNLTEKMGGTISVKSENEKTEFTVVLPAANIERQAREICRQ